MHGLVYLIGKDMQGLRVIKCLVIRGQSLHAVRNCHSILHVSHRYEYLLAAVLVFPFSGCLTKRTVTEGGHKVSEDYVIKRPLKDAVENSR